ncbi:MAG: AraC family transcriptional regulator [Thermomicrobiales bacterium]
MSLAQLQVSERSYDARPRSHHHDYHQVLLPARGCVSLECQSEQGRVGDGRIAVIRAGVEHVYYAEAPNRVVVADFPTSHHGAGGDPVLPPLADAGAFLTHDARLAALTALLQAEAHRGGLADPLVADALLRYLVAALAQAGGTPARDRGVGGAASSRRQIACAAEAYLREHFRQAVSVAEIAQAVGASPAHLHRAFRATTGQTLLGYTHTLRLEEAARLLRDSDTTVAAISQAVGFASQSHLTRLFARHYGCPPGRYRASWQ